VLGNAAAELIPGRGKKIVLTQVKENALFSRRQGVFINLTLEGGMIIYIFIGS
jgi:hypothetical protein